MYDVQRYEYAAEIDIPKIREVTDFDFDPTVLYFPITCMRWASANNLLTSSGDGFIKLWNVKEADPKKRLKSYIYNENISFNAIDVNVDRTMLVSGGMDHCLRVYDLAEMKETVVYHGEDTKHQEHFNRIFSVKVDPSNHNVFYSGGWDKCLITHDIREKHSVASFVGPYITGDSLDINGSALLAGSYRSHDPIEIYDVRTGD